MSADAGRGTANVPAENAAAAAANMRARRVARVIGVTTDGPVRPLHGAFCCDAVHGWSFRGDRTGRSGSRSSDEDRKIALDCASYVPRAVGSGDLSRYQ